MTMPSAGSESAGDDSAPRYEFRIWAPSLAEVRERLERLSGPQPAAQSRETYIVSDATDDTNAKIRADTMDIKVLLRTDQNLEQWSPYPTAHFPNDATLIDRIKQLEAEIAELGPMPTPGRSDSDASGWPSSSAQSSDLPPDDAEREHTEDHQSVAPANVSIRAFFAHLLGRRVISRGSTSSGRASLNGPSSPW